MAGALTHTPADIIRHLLVDGALGTLPSDGGNWPVYVAAEPDTPDNCITVYGTSNVLQGRVMSDGEMQELEGIQVRVRSKNYTTGHAKADAIKRSLDVDVHQDTVTISGTNYLIHVVRRTSGALHLGKDGSRTRRDLFTINAVASLRQSS